MDPMTQTIDPEEGAFYVVKVTYEDGSETIGLGKYCGHKSGMAWWEMPLVKHTGVAAKVTVVRKIDTSHDV